MCYEEHINFVVGVLCSWAAFMVGLLLLLVCLFYLDFSSSILEFAVLWLDLDCYWSRQHEVNSPSFASMYKE